MSVPAGEAFTARAVVRNVGTDTVGLAAGSSCLAFIGIYRSGERQAGFPDTDYGCFAAVTLSKIPPGDSLVPSWTVRTDRSAMPLRRGEYRFRVTFDTNPQLPTLTHRLLIR